MDGEKRIIEILSELLIENQGMRTELIGIHQRVDNIGSKLDQMEDIQVKQSLAIGELRLSVMRLAETIENFSNYEDRLKKLEKVVFRQAS